MPHSHLALLIEQYGYLIIFIGTVLEGETVLVLSAIAAHLGYLSLPLVIIVATIGAVTGDLLCFALGRNYGHYIVSHFSFVARQTSRASALVERYPNISIISFRFIYGLKLSGAILIGMSKVSTQRFVILNFFGATLGAVSITMFGYIFSAAIGYVLSDIYKMQKIFFLVVLAVVALYYIAIFFKERYEKVPLETETHT